MKSGASPHDYSLRPSEARSLQSADLLVWTSSELTPWLDRVLQSNRQAINNVQLMNAPDTIKLPYRQSAMFDDTHDHDHGHSDSGSESHSAAADAIDPHGWLDPVNASYWLDVIAEHVSALDPDNSQLYARNAKAAKEKINTLSLELDAKLSSVRGKPFIVFHDSYHYFEDRFNLFATAAIALADAELPGIRRMNELRTQLREFGEACLFTEPQFNDKLAVTLARDLDISTGTLDPLGSGFEQGPQLYFNLLQHLTDELHQCLSSLAEQ